MNHAPEISAQDPGKLLADEKAGVPAEGIMREDYVFVNHDSKTLCFWTLEPRRLMLTHGRLDFDQDLACLGLRYRFRTQCDRLTYSFDEQRFLHLGLSCECE